MLSMALEMDVFPHEPSFGEKRRDTFLAPSREEINFFIKGYVYKEYERYFKKGLLAGSSLHRALFGNLDGFGYWDF
jgi:hypothetical protein